MRFFVFYKPLQWEYAFREEKLSGMQIICSHIPVPLRGLDCEQLLCTEKGNSVLLILRGSFPLLQLARAVLASMYRHLCRSSFASPCLFVNPCTKLGWTLRDWSVTGGWVRGAALAFPACGRQSCLTSPALGLLNSQCVVSIFSHITVFLQNQKDPHKLSDQQEALCDGQNPLPIYVSVNVRDSYSTNDFKGKDDVSDPVGLKLATEFLWFGHFCLEALGENSPGVSVAFWRNNYHIHALQF